ncbi:MAG TPA: CoA transferase [Xanthobacteraceae bacterium]
MSGFAAGFFGTFNRNKRSFAIDLKADEGRALLPRLVATADVTIEKLRAWDDGPASLRLCRFSRQKSKRVSTR